MMRIPLAGKRPLVSRWQELPEDSPQWAAAERMVARPNWGMRLDGATVVDCDNEQALYWWLANAPETRYQSTSGDPDERRHFWYRGEYPHPGPFSLPGETAHAGDIKSGPGHQVVIPPSVHPDTGAKYQWLYRPVLPSSLSSLPPAPAELIDELRQSPVSWGEGAAGWDRIPEGNRDNALAAMAGLLRRHGASEEALRRAVYLLNKGLCSPPLSDRSVARIARSVARYSSSPNGGGDHGGGEVEIVIEE